MTVFQTYLANWLLYRFQAKTFRQMTLKKKKEALRVTQTLTCFSKISGHK